MSQDSLVALAPVVESWWQDWGEPATLVAATLFAAVSAFLSYWAVRAAVRRDAKRYAIEAFQQLLVARAEMAPLVTAHERATMMFVNWKMQHGNQKLEAYIRYLNAHEVMGAAIRAGLVDESVVLELDLNHGTDLPFIRSMVEAKSAQGVGVGLYVDYLAYLEKLWRKLPDARRASATENHGNARRQLAIELLNKPTSEPGGLPIAQDLVIAQLNADPPKEYLDLLKAAATERSPRVR